MVLRFFRMPGVEAIVFRSFLISGALAAAIAVVMVAAKAPAAIYTVGHGRAIGTFILPGELAGYLIVYLLFAFAVAVGPQRELRLVARPASAVGALAPSRSTYSRAGYAGMAAAIAFFVFMLHGRRGIGFVVGISAVTIVALGIVFNAHHDPSENFTRLSIWQAALAMIARFPLTGVGPFEFGPIYQLLRLPDGEPAAFHAHSFVLTVAAETGLLGVAAVLFGWWRVIAEFRTRLGAAPLRSTVAIAIAAGLVGTWVQGLVDTVSVVIFALWFPFAALALATLDDGAYAAASAVPSRTPRRFGMRIGAVGTIGIVAVVAGFIQLASAASFAEAGTPYSLAAHLPPELGRRMYGALERVAPLPLVEATLADDAIRRGDLAAASEHAARMPVRGAARSSTCGAVAGAAREGAAAVARRRRRSRAARRRHRAGRRRAHPRCVRLGGAHRPAAGGRADAPQRRRRQLVAPGAPGDPAARAGGGRARLRARDRTGPVQHEVSHRRRDARAAAAPRRHCSTARCSRVPARSTRRTPIRSQGWAWPLRAERRSRHGAAFRRARSELEPARTARPAPAAASAGSRNAVKRVFAALAAILTACTPTARLPVWRR